MPVEKIVPGASSRVDVDARWPKEGLWASLAQIEQSQESLVKMPSAQRTAEIKNHE